MSSGSPNHPTDSGDRTTIPRAERQHLNEITASARGYLDQILADHAWDVADLTTETAQWPLHEQRRAFIGSLFEPGDIIWIGEVRSKGERFFKPTSQWLGQKFIRGEFVSTMFGASKS